jgi:hypothetical protein
MSSVAPPPLPPPASSGSSGASPVRGMPAGVSSPAYPTWPPPPSPPIPRRRRRWPLVAGAAAAGAVAVAAITAVVTANVTAGSSGHTGTTAAPATATVTVAAPTPAAPAPLPEAQANGRTCAAWLSAGDLIHAASAALSVIPQGTTILDPAVRANPAWTAGVQKAASLYGQAGDTLAAGIAPGTTSILDQTANAAANALHALSTGYGTFDAASGNTYHVVRESADTMDALCNRLAPR